MSTHPPSGVPGAARPVALRPVVLRPVALRLGLLVLAGGALGCDADPRRGATAEEPRYGGTAVIAGSHDLQTANPLTVSEVWTDEILLHALFLPLVRHDEEGGYEGALARSWENHGDTAFTFQLRRDVRWHDGRPTTAHDVAFTFERAKDPATGFANTGFFDRWEAAEVVDSFTIRFRTSPHMDPLLGWANTAVVPKHLLDTIPPEALGRAAFNRDPVGNGPFRSGPRTTNDRWVLEANPDFPEELGGRPYLDRVVWRVVPESEVQVTELLTGNVHMATSPGADRVAQLDAREGIRAVVRPTRQFVFIGWNGRRDFLGDARVRRALSMAIDRERILRAVRGGYGELANNAVPPSHFAYDTTIAPIPHDTAAARRLLEDAGLRDRDGDGRIERPDGRDFTIELKIPANSAFNRDIAELVRADLDSIGIRLTTRVTEGTTLINDIISPERRFEGVLLALAADQRLDLRPFFHSEEVDGPFQISGYEDPQVDALIDSIATTTDADRSRGLWSRLQRKLSEDLPWTLLWYQPDLYAVSDELRGTDMDIRGAFVSLPRWWLDPLEADTAAQAVDSAAPAAEGVTP